MPAMLGLRFEDQPQRVVSDPNRSDVACFVGFVARRHTPLPAEIARWLHDRQWLPSLNTQSDLINLPTPIDAWESFDRLFAWEQRLLGRDGEAMPSYLGVAVQSFFAQGGRKCYVVRVGDPWPYLEESGDRDARMAQRIEAILPGFGQGVVSASAVDPASWLGVGQLFGLTDVSFLALPDLPDIVRAPESAVEPLVQLPPLAEQFVECSEDLPPAPPDSSAPRLSPPLTDETGYRTWCRAVGVCARFLSRAQREVQLVAALPMPERGNSADLDLLAYLDALPGQPLSRTPDQASADLPAGMASAFVQLAYPWVRTSASANLPQGLASPDGLLTGLLARSALERGAFRSAAGLSLLDASRLTPALRREQADALAPRVSLFAQTPAGFVLLSDVTTSLQNAYRQAPVNRLTAILVRAARRIGEELLFESSSERLWRQVRDQLRWLLDGFRSAGALRGESSQEAYAVRCDRSTMTQNDIDSGRVIAQVRFDPAATVEGITVVLALDEGGGASLAVQR